MATYAYTFTSGDTVTPTKLNNARTVSEIVNADISATAAIAGTKVAPAFGAQDITVSTADRSITNTGNFALSFGTNNAERVRIQTDGSVTFNPTCTVFSNTFAAGNSQTWLVNNGSSGDTYITSDTAQRYRMLTGVGHIWETAVSGTAGGAISWVERMRIDASGNVLIGATSPTFGGDMELRRNANTCTFDIYAAGDATANNIPRLRLINNSSSGSIGSVGGELQFFIAGSSTASMRLTNFGYLGIGTSSYGDASSRLHIAGDLTVSSATTATTASTTSGGSTLPALAAGYLVVSINGTSRKIPYYAT
jgi:hypothetical protein